MPFKSATLYEGHPLRGLQSSIGNPAGDIALRKASRQMVDQRPDGWNLVARSRLHRNCSKRSLCAQGVDHVGQSACDCPSRRSGTSVCCNIPPSGSSSSADTASVRPVDRKDSRILRLRRGDERPRRTGQQQQKDRKSQIPQGGTPPQSLRATKASSEHARRG